MGYDFLRRIHKISTRIIIIIQTRVSACGLLRGIPVVGKSSAGNPARAAGSASGRESPITKVVGSHFLQDFSTINWTRNRRSFIAVNRLQIRRSFASFSIPNDIVALIVRIRLLSIYFFRRSTFLSKTKSPIFIPTPQWVFHESRNYGFLQSSCKLIIAKKPGGDENIR